MGTMSVMDYLTRATMDRAKMLVSYAHMIDSSCLSWFVSQFATQKLSSTLARHIDSRYGTRRYDIA
jgi:hypothetical protein